MNKKDWDDSILKRPGTVFGDIAIREEQRQKKEQRDVSMMTQEMARRNGNSRPWSREKSLGLLGAIGAVATAAALEVAWPWYGWAVLFFWSVVRDERLFQRISGIGENVGPAHTNYGSCRSWIFHLFPDAKVTSLNVPNR